jgi:hypothetical protein
MQTRPAEIDRDAAADETAKRRSEVFSFRVVSAARATKVRFPRLSLCGAALARAFA